MNKKSTLVLRLSLLVLSFIAFAAQSCSKKDNKPKEKAELILGTWHYTAIISERPREWDNNVTGTDGFTYQQACMGATTLTFSKGAAAGTGPFLLYDDCDKSNSQDTWILQSDVLTVAGDDFIVEQLDESTLKLSYKIKDFGEPENKITTTFARK